MLVLLLAWSAAWLAYLWHRWLRRLGPTWPLLLGPGLWGPSPWRRRLSLLFQRSVEAGLSPLRPPRRPLRPPLTRRPVRGW